MPKPRSRPAIEGPRRFVTEGYACTKTNGSASRLFSVDAGVPLGVAIDRLACLLEVLETLALDVAMCEDEGGRKALAVHCLSTQARSLFEGIEDRIQNSVEKASGQTSSVPATAVTAQHRVLKSEKPGKRRALHRLPSK
jgi:hypothetical protein